MMKVYSGKCCLCDTGHPVKATSTYGEEVELHTGDIVILWHGSNIDNELEQWTPSNGLTCVLTDQYQSFTNGEVYENPRPHQPFVMGIKDCGFDSKEWRIQLVKKHSDVIDGEKWPEFGFSYKTGAS